ncbi:MAG: hypothetical protein A2189_08715 [Paenibacillus sp. RIFOXYA1_FULL_44_5]|nr:MAG: hypothetical protein A2189_08715 [Paenibacillus sp. RIFOXYA1_FULL_44_5]
MADEQVSVEHAYRLVSALDHAGKDYAVAIYAERGHAVLPQYEKDMHDHICEWITAQLQQFQQIYSS